jgi:predicted amidophosphoribosyltransferase
MPRRADNESEEASSACVRRRRNTLQACAESLVNLVCPPECLWCSLPTPNQACFCDECRQALVSDYYRCQKCATAIPSVVPNSDCFRCREAGWKFSRVITLGPYRGRRREAIILIKKPSFETLRMGLGGLLGDLVLAELNESGGQPPLIVPVPYHWTHVFAGTAFAANSLARSIGQQTGFPVTTSVARRIRKTAKQGMLSWTERRQNVRGAFEIRRAQELSGRHVLLVDDVLTSGATTGELAGQFLRAGAERVSVVVVARGTGTKDRSPETK